MCISLRRSVPVEQHFYSWRDAVSCPQPTIPVALPPTEPSGASLVSASLGPDATSLSRAGCGGCAYNAPPSVLPFPLPSFFSQIRLSLFACPCLCVRSFRSSFLSDPTSYYPFPTVNPGGHIPFSSLPQTNTFLSFLSVLLLRVQLQTLFQPLSSNPALSSVRLLKDFLWKT